MRTELQRQAVEWVGARPKLVADIRAKAAEKTEAGVQILLREAFAPPEFFTREVVDAIMHEARPLNERLGEK